MQSWINKIRIQIKNSIVNRLILRYSFHCLILVNQSQKWFRLWISELEIIYARSSITRISRISLKSFNRAICVGSQFMNFELLWFLLWLPKQNNIQWNEMNTKKINRIMTKMLAFFRSCVVRTSTPQNWFKSKKKLFYRWLID